MTSVLKLTNIPLKTYQARLVALEADGRVDYTRFLNRYMLVQDEAQSGWQHDVVRELYEALVAQSLPLRETFELFDPHSSGKVTGSGFREVRIY